MLEGELVTRLLSALPSDESTAGNGRLRAELGLDPVSYLELKDAVLGVGYVTAGRGRGGTLAIAEEGRRYLTKKTGPARAPVAPPTGVITPPTPPSEPATPPGKVSVPAGGVSQQELESRLWAAANALRGPVDPADFKAYIFPLLFFKRVSDTLDEEHEAAAADFDDLLTAEVEAGYHRFVVPEGCAWSDLRRIPENLGVGLARILQRIEQANPDTLAGIFGDVAWASKDKLPEPSLLALIARSGRSTCRLPGSARARRRHRR